MLFLNYEQAELDRQYDQRAWAANALDVIRAYTANSDRVRASLGEPEVFAYGPSAAETFDLYRTSTMNAPIHVFIHGGAWRLLGKRDSAFAAKTFVFAGAHFIAVDFALLPTVTLSEMVSQVRSAVAWIYKNAATFGGDAGKIHISGHSSGAHIAACVAATDWEPSFGLPRDVVKSTICASGIYDLLPVRLSSRNDFVGLDSASEQALSPIRHLHHVHSPVFVAFGGLETDEFKRQSREFAQALGPKLAAPLVVYDGLNHFEVAETLARSSDGLGKVALTMMKLRQ